MRPLGPLLLLVAAAVARVPEDPNYRLVFFDDFTGEGLDPTKWEHEMTANGGGNAEFQTYTPDPANSYVQDGRLWLRPTLFRDNINPQTGQPFGEEFIWNGQLDLEALYGRPCSTYWGDGCYRTGGQIPPIASARIWSHQRFDFAYGRAQIRAKMPVGDWLWPALWFMPEHSVYGDWPRSGEIDLTEVIGNRDLFCGSWDEPWWIDIKRIQHGLHWGLSPGDNGHSKTFGYKHNFTQNYGDYFHTWTFDWSPQGMVWYVDDEFQLQVPEPPIMDRGGGNCWQGFYEFGKPWNQDTGDPWNRPGTTRDYLVAPFDQPFHFIFNVAVGGTNWFIPDDCTNAWGDPNRQKPWRNGVPQVEAMHQFYREEQHWHNTWTSEGDNNAMQIDWVRVYERDADNDGTETPPWC